MDVPMRVSKYDVSIDFILRVFPWWPTWGWTFSPTYWPFLFLLLSRRHLLPCLLFIWSPPSACWSLSIRYSILLLYSVLCWFHSSSNLFLPFWRCVLTMLPIVIPLRQSRMQCLLVRKDVRTEEVEELNRTAAQTLTKLSTYEGQLFMEYLEQMAQRTAQLNADPDLRGSIKTAFIQALCMFLFPCVRVM